MRENGCSGKLCPMQVGSVDNCKLTKEQCPYFTQDVDYQAILQVIRSEVAREIFEEIDSYIEKKMSKYNRLINDTIEPTAVQIYGTTNATLIDTKGYIAELKKKYTEGK